MLLKKKKQKLKKNKKLKNARANFKYRPLFFIKNPNLLFLTQNSIFIDYPAFVICASGV